MSQKRIALYIGNVLYPGEHSHPGATIDMLKMSPLTSPILSILNSPGSELVFNDPENVVFNSEGHYTGSRQWPDVIRNLRGGNIREVYLSFSTRGTAFMGSHAAAVPRILGYIKDELGVDGIDIDDESGQFGPSSALHALTNGAIKAGLKLTAAPYQCKENWKNWVDYVGSRGGTVSWLNLQCYAGGKSNNPGEWLDLGVPIVAGSCKHCGSPQTCCDPNEMEALFTLWRTGRGKVSSECWDGVPNHHPQDIGGGFIWAYHNISNEFFAYMAALKRGLGLPFEDPYKQ